MKYPLKQTEPPLIPIRTRYFMEHPEQFSIARLESNEMDRGDGLTPLAKIPDIEDRIRFTRDGGGYFTEVRLVIGRETDKDTGEVEEETVVLGHTSDRMLYGMMITSDIYHDYFDTSGNLIYDLMDPEDETEEEPENEELQDEDSEETTDETEETVQSDLEEELRKLVSEELQKRNRIQLGDIILVRCPKPSSTIRYLKANQHGVCHIQYIYERWYDIATKQNRNHKTTIGQMSNEFPGAMIPNERYKRYFDMETGLPKDQLNKDEQEDQGERRGQNGQSIVTGNQSSPIPEPGEREKEVLHRAVMSYGIDSEEARDAAIDLLHQLIPESSDKETAMNGQGNQYEESLNGQIGRQNKNELESLYEQVNERKERVRVLANIFEGISGDIDTQAKRHPDVLVSTYKARKINAVLLEIRKYCDGSGFEEFLELVQEPEEVVKDGETYFTGMTYSDVQLLFEHYGAVFSHMRYYKM